MSEQSRPEQVMHVMETVTPYTVIRVMEYRWAAQFCKGLKVMDLGCGTGSGTGILAENAREVLGVDINHASIEIAKKTAMPANVQFKLVVEGQLPFEAESFDVIVANNLIERLYNPKDMLLKMNTILKPGGVLILSTVNRELRLFSWQKPYNRLHHQEYSYSSLKNILHKYFPSVELFGIKTTGPFFPDPTQGLFKKKFRLGVYFPLRNFSRTWIRPLFSIVLPRFYPPLGSPLLKSSTKKIEAMEQPMIPMATDMETACKEVVFVQQNLGKCNEIVALCRK